MGNFSVYLTIMSSVLFFGYSLSLSTNGYKSICDKAVKFKELLKMEMDASEGIRKTNISLISAFSLAYLVLLYFSGFAYWFLGAVLLKLVSTLLLSDYFQRMVVEDKMISKRLYILMKLDSIFNAVVGLCTPLLIVL
ncbi:MAG: hypothetical protein GX545_02230 [Fibrobacter sp.]|jgi:hypothetical protein|nr:hypothetical protein [Fibrobacter sp.]